LQAELFYLQQGVSYHEKGELLLIAEGDEQAFYKFYAHYSNQLRPFLLSYTRSETDVEDIIQETFVRVWLNRDRLPEIDNIGGWVYKIASRVYLDHIDRDIKRRDRKASFGESMYGSGMVVSSERTHLNEVSNIIQSVLNNLSEQKRNIFRLNREMQLKPAQIAAHLSMPVGTVKNNLSAILREIREALASAGYGPLAILILLHPLSDFF
jgi:RNA polymerase sigma-70 factor (ECF subfamily)